MDLSVIVLSYNTKDITRECLNRLRFASDRCHKELNNNVEVIVVDNGSTDGSLDLIKNKYPGVKLIALGKNTGFSKGNNLGLKIAKNPYILFLNSDCFVGQDTVASALKFFASHPKCDVLAPKLVFGDGSFQPSAGNLPTPFNIICWILGISLVPGIRKLTYPFHPNYSSFFKNPRQVDWISGAFLLTKRQVLEKVGGFDETIFMYFEEVELCKRINMAGFKIYYVPKIQATHLHGASIGFGSTAPLIRELKGLKYYFQKYYSKSYFLVKMFLILGLILRIIAFSLIGNTKRAKAYVEGLSVI